MGKLSNGVFIFSKWLLYIFFTVMLSVILIEVFSRNIFNHSFPWTEELAKFIFIWITFIGASTAYKCHELVGFDLLKEILPEKMNLYLLKVIHSITLIFTLILFYYGIIQSFSKSVLLQNSIGLGWPMFIPYLGVPIGMLMMIVHSVNFLYSKDPKKGDEL